MSWTKQSQTNLDSDDPFNQSSIDNNEKITIKHDQDIKQKISSKGQEIHQESESSSKQIYEGNQSELKEVEDSLLKVSNDQVSLSSSQLGKPQQREGISQTSRVSDLVPMLLNTQGSFDFSQKQQNTQNIFLDNNLRSQDNHNIKNKEMKEAQINFKANNLSGLNFDKIKAEIKNRLKQKQKKITPEKCIYIVGFPLSGKTTISAGLAGLTFQFDELIDSYIVRDRQIRQKLRIVRHSKLYQDEQMNESQMEGRQGNNKVGVFDINAKSQMNADIQTQIASIQHSNKRLKMQKNIRFVFLISNEFFDDRTGNGMKQIIQEFTLFWDKIPNINKAFDIILTKGLSVQKTFKMFSDFQTSQAFKLKFSEQWFLSRLIQKLTDYQGGLTGVVQIHNPVNYNFNQLRQYLSVQPQIPNLISQNLLELNPSTLSQVKLIFNSLAQLCIVGLEYRDSTLVDYILGLIKYFQQLIGESNCSSIDQTLQNFFAKMFCDDVASQIERLPRIERIKQNKRLVEFIYALLEMYEFPNLAQNLYLQSQDLAQILRKLKAQILFIIQSQPELTVRHENIFIQNVDGQNIEGRTFRQKALSLWRSKKSDFIRGYLNKIKNHLATFPKGADEYLQSVTNFKEFNLSETQSQGNRFQNQKELGRVFKQFWSSSLLYTEVSTLIGKARTYKASYITEKLRELLEYLDRSGLNEQIFIRTSHKLKKKLLKQLDKTLSGILTSIESSIDSTSTVTNQQIIEQITNALHNRGQVLDSIKLLSFSEKAQWLQVNSEFHQTQFYKSLNFQIFIKIKQILQRLNHWSFQYDTLNQSYELSNIPQQSMLTNSFTSTFNFSRSREYQSKYSSDFLQQKINDQTKVQKSSIRQNRLVNNLQQLKTFFTLFNLIKRNFQLISLEINFQIRDSTLQQLVANFQQSKGIFVEKIKLYIHNCNDLISTMLIGSIDGMPTGQIDNHDLKITRKLITIHILSQKFTQFLYDLDKTFFQPKTIESLQQLLKQSKRLLQCLFPSEQHQFHSLTSIKSIIDDFQFQRGRIREQIQKGEKEFEIESQINDEDLTANRRDGLIRIVKKKLKQQLENPTSTLSLVKDLLGADNKLNAEVWDTEKPEYLIDRIYHRDARQNQSLTSQIALIYQMKDLFQNSQGQFLALDTELYQMMTEFDLSDTIRLRLQEILRIFDYTFPLRNFKHKQVFVLKKQFALLLGIFNRIPRKFHLQKIIQEGPQLSFKDKQALDLIDQRLDGVEKQHRLRMIRIVECCRNPNTRQEAIRHLTRVLQSTNMNHRIFNEGLQKLFRTIFDMLNEQLNSQKQGVQANRQSEKLQYEFIVLQGYCLQFLQISKNYGYFKEDNANFYFHFEQSLEQFVVDNLDQIDNQNQEFSRKFHILFKSQCLIDIYERNLSKKKSMTSTQSIRPNSRTDKISSQLKIWCTH